jgi:hypothetical protein
MMWDIAQHKRIGKASLTAPVNGLCLAECGSVFAACDSRVVAIDARTGTAAISPAYESGYDFKCVAALGEEVTAGDSNGLVVQWDVRAMEAPVAVWSWYDAPINKVTYNARKVWVVTVDGTAAQSDVPGKTSEAILGTKAYAPLHSVAIWNQISIWTADDDGMISCFEL